MERPQREVYVHLHRLGGIPALWWELLDEVETARAARFRVEDDRARFVTGVILTKAVVGAEQGRPPSEVSLDRTCFKCRGPHGPPRLPADAGLHLSLTHSGDWVGLAHATVPVGVDIQTLTPAVVDVEGQVLTAREMALSAAAGDPGSSTRTFATSRHWVRKEAVTKALGVGLEIPLVDIDVVEEAAVVAPSQEAAVRSVQICDLVLAAACWIIGTSPFGTETLPFSRDGATAVLLVATFLIPGIDEFIQSRYEKKLN